jgi:Ca2+-binding EF-hand superfamily protein
VGAGKPRAAAEDRPPRDEVREIFRSYDRDGSGSIDAAELARLLEALGMAPTEEDLAVALEVVDANHGGNVSWPEFSAWWRAQATVR